MTDLNFDRGDVAAIVRQLDLKVKNQQKSSVLIALFQRLDQIINRQTEAPEMFNCLPERLQKAPDHLAYLIAQFEQQQLAQLSQQTRLEETPLGDNAVEDQLDEQAALGSSISRMESQQRHLLQLNLLKMNKNQINDMSLNKQFSSDSTNHGKIFVNEQVVNVGDAPVHSQQFTASNLSRENNHRMMSQQRNSQQNPLSNDHSNERDHAMTGNRSPQAVDKGSTSSRASASRVPFIPKLNLLQIAQDQKVKNKRDSSLGAVKQNMTAAAGASSPAVTPELQAVPPLTSHYPILTSCSPEKRVFQFLLQIMNNTNRSMADSAISDEAVQDQLQNFLRQTRQRSTERGSSQLLTATRLRASLGGVSSDRNILRDLKVRGKHRSTRNDMKNTFLQQKNQLVSKVQQLQSQISLLTKRGILPDLNLLPQATSFSRKSEASPSPELVAMNNSAEYDKSATILSGEPMPLPSVKARLKTVAGEVADAMIIRDVAWIMDVGERETTEDKKKVSPSARGAAPRCLDAHKEVVAAIEQVLESASAEELLFFNVSRAMGVMVKLVGSEAYQADKLERDLDLNGAEDTYGTSNAVKQILARLHHQNAVIQLNQKKQQLSTSASTDSEDIKMSPEVTKLLQLQTLTSKQREKLQSMTAPPNSLMQLSNSISAVVKKQTTSSLELSFNHQSLSPLLSDLKLLDTWFLQDLTRQIATMHLVHGSNQAIRPILMIKKLLIDATLRQRHLDFDQSLPITPTLQNGLITSGPSLEVLVQTEIAISQQAFKQLMHATLESLTTLLNAEHSEQTLQVLNEALVSNQAWQTTVEIYIRCLKEWDVISGISLAFISRYGKLINEEELCVVLENFEGVRGIRLIGLNHDEFMRQMSYFEEQIRLLTGAEIELVQMAKIHLRKMHLWLRTAIDYQTATLGFMHRALAIQFPNNVKISSPKNDPYYNRVTPDPDTSAPPPNSLSLFANNPQAKQKYWKSSVRACLEGLRHVYAREGDQSIEKAEMNDSLGQALSSGLGVSLMEECFQSGDWPLQQHLLDFAMQLIKFDEKFTKYIDIDEVHGYCLRFCYSSFVREYSKATHESLEKCKKHLATLIQMASSKNAEIRLKMAQMNILAFYTDQISLETKYRQMHKSMQKAQKKQQETLNATLERMSPSGLTAEKPNINPEPGSVVEPSVVGPVPPVMTMTKSPPALPFGMPSASFQQQPLPHPFSDSSVIGNAAEPFLGYGSDSSDAPIPPMLVQPQKRLSFNLPIGNLGLSTVAPDGGKTAEQLADAAELGGVAGQSASDTNPKFPGGNMMPAPHHVPPLQSQVPMPPLLQVQSPVIGQASKQEPIVELQTFEDDSSDDYLPPPVPTTAPKGPSLKLAIGGLSLSTVAKEGEMTAEQQADADTLMKAKAPKGAMANPDNESHISEEGKTPSDASSSDDYIPPPVPQPGGRPAFGLKLAIGGLGLSTVAGADGKTAEEQADADILAGQKQKKLQPIKERSSPSSQSSVPPDRSESSSDGALPPPLPIQPVRRGIPSLAIGGLSLSTVIKEGEQMTQEQKMDAAVLKQSRQQKNKKADSESSDLEGGSREDTMDKPSNASQRQFKTINQKKTPLEFARQGSNASIKGTIKLRNQALHSNPGKKVIKQKINSKKLQQVLEQQTSKAGTKVQLHLPRKEGKKLTLKVLDRKKDQKSVTLDHEPAVKEDLQQPEIMQRLQEHIYADMTAKQFYEAKKAEKVLYRDPELHALVITLILTLLLKPQRGTLDDQYCHSYPILNGKENYLYILQKHLATSANQKLIPLLPAATKSQRRLLRLLCPSLFNLALYQSGEMVKLAEGAYGKVYDSETQLDTPSRVAIKVMAMSDDIGERCVLHDIFNEITVLEELRESKCVTDLYDYGADRSSYYIVMRKYDCSLRGWRLQHGDDISVFQRNLKLYASIYLKVLKGLKTIHQSNITHYDLKCDNVMLTLRKPANEATEADIDIAIGDFGTANLFFDEKDEFCRRNLGTDCIKSPEMLMVEKHACKEDILYDRRKKVGSTRLSDIWSIGCLFYELCTGDHLLHDEDWLVFLNRVISKDADLVPPAKAAKIDHNQYIIDFLKFILVRDQRLRPSIDKVIQQFELIHAILHNLSDGRSLQPAESSDSTTQPKKVLAIQGNQQLHESLQQAAELIENDHLLFKREKNADKPVRTIMKIMADVYLTKQSSEDIDPLKLQASKISHIVAPTGFQVLGLFEYLHYDRDMFNSPLQAVSSVQDFIRWARLHGTAILFVDRPSSNLMKEALLVCHTMETGTDVFDALSVQRSANLLLKVAPSRLSPLSKFCQLQSSITAYLKTFPQFSCACGRCLIILERSYAQYQNIQTMLECGPSCVCQGTGQNCQRYLSFFEQYHKESHISLEPTGKRQVVWGVFERQDFILGPESTLPPMQVAIASNLSAGIRANTVSQELKAWTIHTCATCRCPTHATSAGQTAILLNNRI